MSILSSAGAGKSFAGTKVNDMFYALTKISDFIKEYYDYAPTDDAGTKSFCYRVYFEVQLKKEVAEKEKSTLSELFFNVRCAKSFIVDVQQKLTMDYEYKKNKIICKHLNNKKFGKYFMDAEIRNLRFEEILKTLTKTIHTTLLNHHIKTSDIEYISIINVGTDNTQIEQELFRTDIPADYSMYRDHILKEMYPNDTCQQLINSYSYICL